MLWAIYTKTPSFGELDYMSRNDAAETLSKIATDEWIAWIQTLAADDFEEAMRETLDALEKRRKIGETAAALRVLIREFRRRKPSPAGGFITTGKAAEMLSIKSVSTIKRWVSDGIIEGYKFGGRVMVSRDSVEELLAGPTLADQKKRDGQIDFEARVDNGLRALGELDSDVVPDETDWGEEPGPWDKTPDGGNS